MSARRRGGRAAKRAERAARARRHALPPGGDLSPADELAITSDKGAGRTLVIACGALAKEIIHLKAQLGADRLDLHCLPAEWHNTPRHIPAGVRARIRQARAEGYENILVAYGDCGTGGGLDAVLAEEGIERLPGAHCYAFLSGLEAFEKRLEADARSYFLTDYLARHFDTLIWKGMMLDRHPELLGDYFGNYEKLVYLAQSDDPALLQKAREAAQRLKLAFEHRRVGYGDLETALRQRA
ncbi:MAG TPA: DUF1638 domain-containing protein [Thermopetrobacter sp.]|nr:DUF1638 domain-containing protein [Thermopetrobacter sp.]